MIELELPPPPSVNHYYRHVGPRVLISKLGRQYREFVQQRLRFARAEKMPGPLSFRLDFYPPDRRRRDLDNLFKCLLDALQFGGAYSDDNQIMQITATKREPLLPDGLVYIKLEPYVNDQISGPR